MTELNIALTSFKQYTTTLFLIFLHFYVYFFFGFPICIQIQSVPIAKNLRKANLQKTGVNITIVYTFTETPLSASAVKFQETNYICEQHINNTSNIQRTTFANNYPSEDPEKTNLGTVKMMEAKCEVIVIILIDKSGYYLQ